MDGCLDNSFGAKSWAAAAQIPGLVVVAVAGAEERQIYYSTSAQEPSVAADLPIALMILQAAAEPAALADS